MNYAVVDIKMRHDINKFENTDVDPMASK